MEQSFWISRALSLHGRQINDRYHRIITLQPCAGWFGRCLHPSMHDNTPEWHDLRNWQTHISKRHEFLFSQRYKSSTKNIYLWITVIYIFIKLCFILLFTINIDLKNFGIRNGINTHVARFRSNTIKSASLPGVMLPLFFSSKRTHRHSRSYNDFRASSRCIHSSGKKASVWPMLLRVTAAKKTNGLTLPVYPFHSPNAHHCRSMTSRYDVLRARSAEGV